MLPFASVADMLTPTSVAVIGASERYGSRGFHIWRAVSASTGILNIWPVNPKYKYVGETRCYASADDIPASIDLAIVAVERRRFPEIIRSLESKRPAAILFAPQEEGLLNDKGEIAALLEAAHRIGMRVFGPNSIGFMVPPRGINASYWPTLPRTGNIAVAAHSGMVATSLVDQMQSVGHGFSAVVDVGLEIDLLFADLIDCFAADRSVRVIALHVEALREPRRFFSALRAAAEEKPVVILHAGDEAGFAADRIAASRFDCDAGEDAAFDALCRQAGALRVKRFEDFCAGVAAFASGRRAYGRRTAVIANNAGFAGMAANAVSNNKLLVEGFSADTTAQLHALRPLSRIPTNPLLLGPSATPELIRDSLEVVLKDPAVDNVLVALAPSPMTAYDPTFALLAETSAQHMKPIAAAWMSESLSNTVRQQITSVPNSRLIAMRSLEDAASGLGMLAARYEAAKNRRMRPEVARWHLEANAFETIRAVFAEALEEGRHTLSTLETASVLSAAGFSTVPFNLVHTHEEAQTAAALLGYPVVLKAAARGMSRRTAAGLVFLNISNEAELEAAWRKLAQNLAESAPFAQPEGLLVEKMLEHRNERELRMRIRYDAVLGPVIEYASAGIIGTFRGNSVSALPPISLSTALSIVSNLEANKALDAFRGVPPANRLLIALTLCRLSDIAQAVPAIREFRIEPLVPFENRIVVLGAAISLYDAPLTPSRGFPHLTIAAAPVEDVEAIQCRSGRSYVMRTVTEEDFERMRRFVDALSDKSFYMRFHTSSRLSDERIAAFCRLDYDREGAWAVVETDERGTEQFCAVARWHITSRSRESEFGIVVRDDRQRLGLARVLMNKIEREALLAGQEVLVGYVLNGNTAMEGLMSSLGYAIDRLPAHLGSEVSRWVKPLSTQ